MADGKYVSTLSGPELDAALREVLEVKTTVRTELQAAKDSGEFNGKSAYAYAQDGGFIGTEKEFAYRLATKPDWVPTKVPYGGDALVISEQTLSSGIWSKLQMFLQPGIIYAVIFNGEKYVCAARADGSGVELGNNTSFTLNDYPFCIKWAGGSATSGMFFKRSDIGYPVTLKVTEHSGYVYNKMPEGYLPDGVVKSVNGKEPDPNGNVEISTGGGSGDASINVTAEVGQTIVVQAVDGSGKPTQWKAVDMPVGAKIYSPGELSAMSWPQLLDEYRQHPIIVRAEGINNDINANILLTINEGGKSGGGIGFSSRQNDAVWFEFNYDVDGIMRYTCRALNVPSFERITGENGKGLLFYDGSTWTFENENKYLASATMLIIETPLTDGATITVPVEDYFNLQEAVENQYKLTLITMDPSFNPVMLPALYLSTTDVGYPTTVKCFDPAGNGIITVTLIPG